jgi:hypothetical protein
MESKAELIPIENPKAAMIRDLAKFQGRVSIAEKDEINPHFKKTYATLASYVSAIHPHLEECNLAYTQTIEGTKLVTTLWHTSGESIKSECELIGARQDPQGIGSALSYYRRYQLAGILGMAAADDDGNEAQPKPVKTKAEKQQGYKDYKNGLPSAEVLAKAKADNDAPPWNEAEGEKADLFDKVTQTENQIAAIVGFNSADFKKTCALLYNRHNANCADGEKTGNWKMALASAEALLKVAKTYIPPTPAKSQAPEDTDFKSANPIPAQPELLKQGDLTHG